MKLKTFLLSYLCLVVGAGATALPKPVRAELPIGLGTAKSVAPASTVATPVSPATADAPRSLNLGGKVISVFKTMWEREETGFTSGILANAKIRAAATPPIQIMAISMDPTSQVYVIAPVNEPSMFESCERMAIAAASSGKTFFINAEVISKDTEGTSYVWLNPSNSEPKASELRCTLRTP